MWTNEKINKTNDKALSLFGIQIIFVILGFILGTIISYMITGTKPSTNPKPPIPTNYSLEQKNYVNNGGNGSLNYYNNGISIEYTALVLNNGSIIANTGKNNYFLNDTLIDMNIDNIFIFNGENIQYGLINTNKKTILVNTNNLLKPLLTLNIEIDKYYSKSVVFNSFINIFTLINNKQECIKIDTRSFNYKIIPIFLDNKQISRTSFLIEQGNIYTVNTKTNDLYVLDINQQIQNIDNFNYKKLFNLDSTKYDFFSLINFDDNTIYNNLIKEPINYNLFLIDNKSSIRTLNMFDKNGISKLDLKDFNEINSYLYAFSTKERNMVNLINLSKSIFSDKPIIFSKKITNNLFEKNLLVIQDNNNDTYSIVIYNKEQSLLDNIVLKNDFTEIEILKIKDVNDFNFKWLNNETSTLQISKRPIVSSIQRNCYYITTPNQKSIILWKNEQLIKKYENNWEDENNFSPFLLALNDVPIIVTKNEFFINDKNFENTTDVAKDGTTKINIVNDKAWIENFTTNTTSIIYLKSNQQKLID